MIVKFLSQFIDSLSFLLDASFLNNSRHLLLLKRFPLVFYAFKKFHQILPFYQIVNFLKEKQLLRGLLQQSWVFSKGLLVLKLPFNCAQVIEKNLQRVTLVACSLYAKNGLFYKCSYAQRLEYCYECMNFRNRFVFYGFTANPSSVMVKLALM